MIAASVALARDAAEAIDIRYDTAAHGGGRDGCRRAGRSRRVAAGQGNVACEMRHGSAEATAAAFRDAAHVVALDLVNQRVAPCPIEPRSRAREF